MVWALTCCIMCIWVNGRPWSQFLCGDLSEIICAYYASSFFFVEISPSLSVLIMHLLFSCSPLCCHLLEELSNLLSGRSQAPYPMMLLICESMMCMSACLGISYRLHIKTHWVVLCFNTHLFCHGCRQRKYFQQGLMFLSGTSVVAEKCFAY